MNHSISGSRLRKELGKYLPAHRLSLSEAFRFVHAQPDSLQDVAYIVATAVREGVPVLPASSVTKPLTLEGWHIRLSLSRLSAISDFSPDSRLVCAQAGTKVGQLVEWLMDKGHTLGVTPEFAEEMELWEFLLGPETGRFGPRFGCKWEQVFSLTAILPNGRFLKGSLSPARATGPDFSQVVLRGMGSFGLPLEIYLRIRALPRRRMLLAFEVVDLAAAYERAWTVAREVAPEHLELGVDRPGSDRKIPTRFAVVELWGEGKSLTSRKERVRKLFGDSARPTDVPYEALLGMEDTCRFTREDCFQLFASRAEAAGLLAAISAGAAPAGRMRILGFSEGHACIVADRIPALQAAAARGMGPAPSSPDGQALLDGVAKDLDPAGIFARIPETWRRERAAFTR
jgi:FAD/FMN-containing dehydrogenase